MNRIMKALCLSLLILSAGSAYAQTTTDPMSPTSPNTPPAAVGANSGFLSEICDQGTCTVSNLFNPSMPWMGTASGQSMIVGERIIGTALFPAQPRYNAVPAGMNNGVSDWRVIAFIDGKTPDIYFVPMNTLTEFVAFANNHNVNQMDLVVGCPETTVQLCGQSFDLPLARNQTTRQIHYVNPQFANVTRDVTYQCNAPALPRGAWGIVPNSDVGSCTPPQCVINGTTDAIYANQAYRHGQNGGWNWAGPLPSLGNYDIGTTITVVQRQAYGICGPDDTNYITYNCVSVNNGAQWTEAFNCVPPPVPPPAPPATTSSSAPTPPSGPINMCTNNMTYDTWMNQPPTWTAWGLGTPVASLWAIDPSVNTYYYLCDWSVNGINVSDGGGAGGSSGGDD